MGAGVAWLFSLFLALIIAGVLGFFFWLVTYLCVRKKQFEGKQILLILASLTPYLFIILEFVLLTIGDIIVSERHPYVSWNVGDEWSVPINDDYYLFAIDLPEQAGVCSCETGTMLTYYDTIRSIWINNDTTIVLLSDTTSRNSIYVFYPHSSDIDTLLFKATSSQLDNFLAEREWTYESAMNPDAYFARGQAIAHKYESIIRNVLVLSFIIYLWVNMILYIKKKNKTSPSEKLKEE